MRSTTGGHCVSVQFVERVVGILVQVHPAMGARESYSVTLMNEDERFIGFWRDGWC